MKLLKPLLVAAAAFAASQAQAVTTFTYSFNTSPTGVYAAPTFTSINQATVQTSSLTNVYLKPQGNVSSFLVVSTKPTNTQGAALINTAGASSYSFLWGSPDTYNFVDIYDSPTDLAATYSGTQLGQQFGPMAMTGKNSETGLFTITASGGGIDHLVLRSQGVAFEVAAPVPEPETYALMLGGLGALAFVSRRRHRA